MCVCVPERERHRERETETDRHRDTERQRQTDRQRGRETLTGAFHSKPGSHTIGFAIRHVAAIHTPTVDGHVLGEEGRQAGRQVYLKCTAPQHKMTDIHKQWQTYINNQTRAQVTLSGHLRLQMSSREILSWCK